MKTQIDITAFRPSSQSPVYDQAAGSGTNFRKKLGWLIAESPDALRMTITPEMAMVMMERNETDEWRNRPKSKFGVQRFARAMTSGRWVYTGETICFSVLGRLLNGQHRLSACVEAGVSFESLVAFGVPDEAFKFYDQGISRTAGNVFAIEGIPHYNFAASACRVVMSYLASEDWGGSPDGGSNRRENDELLEFFYDHEDILQSYQVAMTMNREGLMAPRWAGALHYICALRNRDKADAFFDKVATGLGIDNSSSPEYLIRKRLEKSARAQGDSKEADVYLAAYMVQAWNAHRSGRKLSIFRWRGASNPNQKFPRAM